MLYYLLFWTILGFIFHFYIIFGTNLLTGGPAQNCCFLPISVFRINRISNGVQNLRERDFLTERDPGDLDPTLGGQRGGHEGGGAPPPRAPPASWAPRCSTDVLLPPIYTHVPPNDQNRSQNLIPPPQLSVSTRSHLGACSRAPSEEGRHHGGLLHHPSPFDEV